MLRSCNLPENDCKAVLSALQSKFILIKWKNHYRVYLIRMNDQVINKQSLHESSKTHMSIYLFI
jgi:hypothetical protein